MPQSIENSVAAEAGVTAIDNASIASLIAVFVTAVTTISAKVGTLFNEIGAALKSGGPTTLALAEQGADRFFLIDATDKP